MSLGEVGFCPDPDPTPLYVHISVQFVTFVFVRYVATIVTCSDHVAQISSPFRVTVLVVAS